MKILIIKILQSIQEQVTRKAEPELYAELIKIAKIVEKKEVGYEGLCLLYQALVNKAYLKKYKYGRKSIKKVLKENFKFDCKLFNTMIKAKLTDDEMKLIFEAKEAQGDKSDVAFYNEVCLIFESQGKLAYLEKNFDDSVCWFNLRKKLKLTQVQENQIDYIYKLEENGDITPQQSIAMIYKKLKNTKVEYFSVEQMSVYLDEVLPEYNLKPEDLESDEKAAEKTSEIAQKQLQSPSKKTLTIKKNELKIAGKKPNKKRKYDELMDEKTENSYFKLKIATHTSKKIQYSAKKDPQEKSALTSKKKQLPTKNQGSSLDKKGKDQVQVVYHTDADSGLKSGEDNRIEIIEQPKKAAKLVLNNNDATFFSEKNNPQKRNETSEMSPSFRAASPTNSPGRPNYQEHLILTPVYTGSCSPYQIESSADDPDPGTPIYEERAILTPVNSGSLAPYELNVVSYSPISGSSSPYLESAINTPEYFLFFPETPNMLLDEECGLNISSEKHDFTVMEQELTIDNELAGKNLYFSKKTIRLYQAINQDHLNNRYCENHQKYLGDDDVQYIEFEVPKDGFCGFLALGLDANQAIFHLKESYDKNKNIKENIISDMKNAFRGAQVENKFKQRFISMDEKEYLKVSQEFVKLQINKKMIDKNKVIDDFCQKNIENYLNTFENNMSKNDGVWYISFYMLSALAASQNCKLEIYEKTLNQKQKIQLTHTYPSQQIKKTDINDKSIIRCLYHNEHYSLLIPNNINYEKEIRLVLSQESIFRYIRSNNLRISKQLTFSEFDKIEHSSNINNQRQYTEDTSKCSVYDAVILRQIIS